MNTYQVVGFGVGFLFPLEGIVVGGAVAGLSKSKTWKNVGKGAVVGGVTGVITVFALAAWLVSQQPQKLVFVLA